MATYTVGCPVPRPISNLSALQFTPFLHTKTAVSWIRSETRWEEVRGGERRWEEVRGGERRWEEVRGGERRKEEGGEMPISFFFSSFSFFSCLISERWLILGSASMECMWESTMVLLSMHMGDVSIHPSSSPHLFLVLPLSPLSPLPLPPPSLLQ